MRGVLEFDAQEHAASCVCGGQWAMLMACSRLGCASVVVVGYVVVVGRCGVAEGVELKEQDNPFAAYSSQAMWGAGPGRDIWGGNSWGWVRVRCRVGRDAGVDSLAGCRVVAQ